MKCPKCGDEVKGFLESEITSIDGQCQICTFQDNNSAKADMVNHPPHYKDASGVECIEVTKYMGFCDGNCFKYLYRAGQKGDIIEDLKKAKWYAERAWLMEAVTPDKAIDNINKVMSHRHGNIHKAMYAITQDMWAVVERHIDDEIERLSND